MSNYFLEFEGQIKEEKSELKKLRAELKRLRTYLFRLSRASSREEIREALRAIPREELAKAGIV